MDGRPPRRPSAPAGAPSPKSSTPTPRRNWARPPRPSSAPGCPSSSNSSPPAPRSPRGPPRPDPGQAGLRGRGAPERPLDAPHRNYKDANHKPELICALTEFDGLCGFRAPAETADLLDGLGVASLKPYVDLLRAHPRTPPCARSSPRSSPADPEEMSRTVTETAAACDRLGGAYAPYADIAHHYPGDPGVLAAMLLNHVRLQPGEALFLGAGIPHAYLDGLGVEIMANSDNVLRCGLTPSTSTSPNSCASSASRPATPASSARRRPPTAKRSTTPRSTSSACPGTSSPRAPASTTSPCPPHRSCSARPAPYGRASTNWPRPVRLRPGGRNGRSLR